MKNFKNRIFAGLAAIVFITSACELDLEPIDSIGDQIAFETIEDLEKGMVGIMGSYGGTSAVGAGDWASDDLRYALSNTGQGVQVHNWTYTASTGNISGTWYVNASLVTDANRMLEIANRFDENDDRVKRIKAECIFTRAYAHFEIARLYCKPYSSTDPLGIPYKYDAAVSKPARLPQGEVYSNILKDIDECLNGLEEERDSYYWLSKSTAYALKARVALHMGDWDMAINAVEKVIIDGNYRIANSEEFASIWTDQIVWHDDATGVKNEVIFAIKEAGPGGYYNRTTNEDVFFHPSYDLMNQYEMGDIRSTVYFDKDKYGKDIVNKHIIGATGERNVTDLKLFRVSELFLIKAEAYAQQSMLTETAIQLNRLRANRVATSDTLAFDTMEEAMLAVQLERRRELAYEGHRFYDLKRWNLGIERIDEDSELSSKVLPAGDYRFVYPIPQEEIFANENMVQNDGYSN